MADAIPTTLSEIAQAILDWCGISTPTPVDATAAELAADSAISAIKHYRRLDDDAPLEPEYRTLAIEMGAYLFQKRGVDGVTAYSEAGLQRAYEVGSFPPSMLARIRLPIVTG